MRLILKRTQKNIRNTLGTITIDGRFECYTLEDTVRPAGEKVDGQTAIPEGEYKVIVDQSKRFGRLMPHLLNVPGFEGIRIHAGNTDADTEGCILVGCYQTKANVTGSRTAFNALFEKLLTALARPEVVTVLITSEAS